MPDSGAGPTRASGCPAGRAASTGRPAARSTQLPGRPFPAVERRVERYDLAARRVSERWPLAGRDPVFIRALVQGAPLSLTQDQAFLGTNLIDAASAGPIRGLSTTDRQIVTVRDQR